MMVMIKISIRFSALSRFRSGWFGVVVLLIALVTQTKFKLRRAQLVLELVGDLSRVYNPSIFQAT